uniref:Putative transposase-like protein n=1 Tax=Ixodes ricinus TaxID=34613 RepID=A0A6B0V2L9_IXORI
MGLLLAPGFSCVPRVRSCDDKLQARDRSADRYTCRCAVWMTREVHKRKPVKVQCRGQVSVRSGSFFEGSHLKLPQLMKIIYLRYQNLPCAVIQRETDIASKTITDWASFCREVVVNAVFKHSDMIGGEDVTVELDQSMFGRRKYHRGYLRPGQWVFGDLERGSGCCFLVPVDTCDAKIPARANNRVGPP